MSVAIKMPALSPTMEEGAPPEWLVKEGDQVKSGVQAGAGARHPARGDNKLKPQGGAASISTTGMYAIKQLEAVIDPPQDLILAIGAGEKRPWATPDDSLGVATIMSGTGSFDHLASDRAGLMKAFKQLVEAPMLLAA